MNESGDGRVTTETDPEDDAPMETAVSKKPRPDGLIPRPRKKNVGNRHRRVRISGKGRAPAWDEDIAIRARVENVLRLTTRGYRGLDLLNLVNSAEF